jgi:hypothetical protein
MSSHSVVTLDGVLDYATLENLIYLSGGLILLKLGQLSYWPIRQLFSPLRHLRGPKNDSIIFGNLKRIFAAPSSVLHEEWMEQYGSTYAYRIFMSVCDAALFFRVF